MLTFKRLLVPVDFSTASNAALEIAIDLALRFDASVEVLHAVETPVYAVPDLSVSVAGAPLQNFAAFAVQSAEEDLKKFLAPFQSGAGAKIKLTSTIHRGEPTQTILSVAKDGGFDLIVMGTHGRTGLDHVLLGSVTERVIRKAPCAVLTTRRAK